MSNARLILASGSAYRRQQLEAAGYAFEVLAANIDESPKAGEQPKVTAQRLAYAKAIAVLTVRPSAIVIGSDQVCALNGEAIGKPGNREAAVAQLLRMANQEVVFHSAVTVLSAGQAAQFSVPTTVKLRNVTKTEVEGYVALDEPLDTAGAIKSEQAGALLFESNTSDDPSALIGLPLIKLSATLRDFGINPLLSTAPNTAETRPE